ncbi:DUF2147 domain-containing protein [Sphingomonas panacisoli]|uniref:DUF2147 domain-containing protein n=1 Tax=Sphingomonas panacisoli TaxID=1813879 RepID=A0A5B8LEM6_9SPHN|nr:DUF2147 domain-containing protein [Sphingomonas panacisoli]QDZ06587.1 DUF2147 domain-containing protein [Sphingomonas panacisoli]
MIRTFVAGLALVFALPALAAQPIAGRWWTADRGALVAIGPCGAALCGRIVKLVKGPPSGPPVDALNPDPKLRSRPLVGLAILLDLKPDGDGWKGRIYDPKTGKTYRAAVTRDGANLKVQGCVAVFCQTMTWAAG